MAVGDSVYGVPIFQLANTRAMPDLLPAFWRTDIAAIAHGYGLR